MSKLLYVFVVGIFLFGKSMASAADDTCTMNYVVDLGLTSDCVFDRAMPPLFVPGTLQTSYELQASALNTDINEIRRLNGQSSGDLLAYTYGDFDGDGDEDFFVAPSYYKNETTPVEIYFNDGGGNFRLDNSFFQGSIPELVHPRKAITGDFNGDGRLDIFIAGHGYDKPPYPGEAPVLLLSTENGLRQVEGLDHLAGFHHGAAAADIDNDGDLDIFVTDNIADGPFFLINDGDGVFHTMLMCCHPRLMIYRYLPRNWSTWITTVIRTCWSVDMSLNLRMKVRPLPSIGATQRVNTMVPVRRYFPGWMDRES